MLRHAFTGVIEDPLYRMGQMSIERSHPILGDGILKFLQRGLLQCLGAGRVGEVEDMLGEKEIGVLDVLGIGAHVGCQATGIKERGNGEMMSSSDCLVEVVE